MHKIPKVFKIQFFPAENMFCQFFNKFLIRDNGISHSLYVKFEINVNSLILWKLPTLFSTVKLKIKFSQFIHGFKIGTFCVGLMLQVFPN